MKLVLTSTFNLPPLEYFTEELEWRDYDSIEEIADELATWDEKELIEFLGCCVYSSEIRDC